MITPQNPSRRRSLAVALAGALALGLGACGSAEPATPAEENQTGPVTGGTLNWAIETKLQTVNPHRNGQDKAVPILRNAFDSYLFRTPDGGYEPWLAEAFTVSEDGLQVVLDLRSDITFSDGAPLDADAVVANFDKVHTEGYLTSIPGGLRFLSSYEKTGDHQVTFNLERPDSLFLVYLSHVNSTPLSPASLELDQTVLESGGPEVAGTGAFVIESFTPNTELVFDKREDYEWAPASVADGQEEAHLDSVTYRTFTEGATRTGALLQGQVQVASDIQPLDVATFEETEGFNYQRNQVGGLPYTLYFNVSKPPLDDPLVREAFVKGADLDAIINAIYSGAFDRAQAPISIASTFAHPDSLDDYVHDVEEANRLLDEAGWTERNQEGVRVKDGTPLTVRAVSGAPFVRESRDQLNLAIGAALKQNIGLDYQFQIEDTGTESARSAANDYEVFDNSYGGADPATGVDLLYWSDAGRGFIARGRYQDDELDALIDRGRFTTDTAERQEAYQELQELVASNFWSLPLYQTQDNIAASDEVQGITIDESTGQPFGAYKIWLDG